MSEEATIATPAAPAESGGETPAQKPAGEAPATPAGEKPADQNTPNDPAEKRNGTSRFERRIANAYRREAEAKARADLLEKQLNELRTPKAETPKGEPQISQFSDVEEYAKAKAEWARSDETKRLAEKQSATHTERQQQALLSSWEQRQSAGDEKYDDFDEVVGDLKPTTPWAAALMQADNGEDIAYYLGSHLDEARKVAAMDPLSQIRFIGRLEAKLLAEPPKQKAPSKAPPPITPLGGTKTAGGDAISPDDDMKTFIRKRNKQLGRG